MKLTHTFFSLQSTHLWPFCKSEFNLKSDRVNLVALASPIECLLYLPNVRAIQYKLGPERLTRLGNLNVLRLPVRGFVHPHHRILNLHKYTELIRTGVEAVQQTFMFSAKINKVFLRENCIIVLQQGMLFYLRYLLEY